MNDAVDLGNFAQVTKRALEKQTLCARNNAKRGDGSDVVLSISFDRYDATLVVSYSNLSGEYTVIERDLGHVIARSTRGRDIANQIYDWITQRGLYDMAADEAEAKAEQEAEMAAERHFESRSEPAPDEDFERAEAAADAFIPIGPDVRSLAFARIDPVFGFGPPGGDEGAFKLFAEFEDEMIAAYHNGDLEQTLDGGNMDPERFEDWRSVCWAAFRLIRDAGRMPRQELLTRIVMDLVTTREQAKYLAWRMESAKLIEADGDDVVYPFFWPPETPLMKRLLAIAEDSALEPAARWEATVKINRISNRSSGARPFKSPVGVWWCWCPYHIRTEIQHMGATYIAVIRPSNHRLMPIPSRFVMELSSERGKCTFLKRRSAKELIKVLGEHIAANEGKSLLTVTERVTVNAT